MLALFGYVYTNVDPGGLELLVHLSLFGAGLGSAVFLYLALSAHASLHSEGPERFIPLRPFGTTPARTYAARFRAPGYSVERDPLDGRDHWIVVPEEAEIVREIIENVALGATLYSVAKRLNEAGIPSPGQRYRGDTRRRNRRTWLRETVRDIVRQSPTRALTAPTKKERRDHSRAGGPGHS